MKYSEAKPYLKEGMKVKIIKCKYFEDLHGLEGIITRQTRDGFVIETDHNGSVGYDDGHPDDELEILTNPDGSKWCNHYYGISGRCLACGCDFLSIENIFLKEPKEPPYPNHEDYPTNSLSPTERQYLLGLFPPLSSLYQPLTNEPKAHKGFIMNVVDKIKNFKLTKEDRILRENGLEDEDGKMTEVSTSMVHNEMIEERWATRRLEIAKDLLEIKNEEIK